MRYFAKVTAGIILAAVAFAGCSGSTSESIRSLTLNHQRSPVPEKGTLHISDYQLQAAVMDPGASGAFTLLVHYLTRYVVMPTSAATAKGTIIGQPSFASQAAERRWRQAGSPPLEFGASKSFHFPNAGYDFLAQGAPLTYRDVTSLRTAHEIRAVIARRLPRTLSNRTRTTAWLLKQYGFLLATGPLSPAGWSAAWRSLESIPGIYACGDGRDALGRRGVRVCGRSGGEVVSILIKQTPLTVLEVTVRLESKSPMYPTVLQGTTIESDTFLVKS